MGANQSCTNREQRAEPQLVVNGPQPVVTADLGSAPTAQSKEAELQAALEAKEAELQVLRAKLDRIEREGLDTHGLAKGETHGIDAMNQALWRMGALKHKPPSFRYFDPGLEEKRSVKMKEVKLHRSAQTHELCYEPHTRCLFVSQMSDSVLVRIPVGPDGLLADDQDAWHVGPVDSKGDGVSGLHNISRSFANPGCLWLSLQFANMLLLLDAATMGVRQVIRVPQLFTRADGTTLRIGGPHCVRECGQTGSIWVEQPVETARFVVPTLLAAQLYQREPLPVALKGSVPCHPSVQGSSTKSLAAAVSRVCCNPEAIRARIEAAAALADVGSEGDEGGGRVAEMEEGYAVWRLHPSRYDPSAPPAFGGALFETEPSPPMVAIDRWCNCWVAQDQAPALARIDTKASVVEQHRVQLPPTNTLPMTGPAIATAPDGAIWCSLLGGDGALLRVDPATGRKMRYELGSGAGSWMKTTRFIHMIFHEQKDWWVVFNGKRCVWPTSNFIYLISSNLVDDEAVDAITVIRFNEHVGSGWTAPWTRKEIPLPTQDCCCHRIEAISDEITGHARESIVVSELASSRLFQICNLDNLEVFDFPYEEVSVEVDGDGAEVTVLQYTYSKGANSKNNNTANHTEYFKAASWYQEVQPPEDDGSIRFPSRGQTAADFPPEAREAVQYYLDVYHRPDGLLRRSVAAQSQKFHECHRDTREDATLGREAPAPTAPAPTAPATAAPATAASEPLPAPARLNRLASSETLRRVVGGAKVWKKDEMKKSSRRSSTLLVSDERRK